MGALEPARFPERYPEAYVEALGRAETVLRELSLQAPGDPALARLGAAVVFPELARYSFIRDMIETSALEFSYIAGGSADFSIGEFQMKPSFAERLEALYPSELRDRHPSWYAAPAEPMGRRAGRLSRLKSREGQIEYLAGFIELMRYRYPDWRSDEAAAARLFSVAYNAGLDASRDDCEALYLRETFPYGPKSGREQFSYAALSAEWYAERFRERSPPALERAISVVSDELDRIQEALWAAGTEKAVSERILDLVRRSMDGSFPPTESRKRYANEALCAQAAAEAFRELFGGEDNTATARGVAGDAWNMAGNIRFFGGRSMPWSTGSRVRPEPGDFVGIWYADSVYNARRKPVDYTHVALVLAEVPGRGTLIAHAFNPPVLLLPRGSAKPPAFRVEYLEEFLSLMPGLFEPRELMRPRGKPVKAR